MLVALVKGLADDSSHVPCLYAMWQKRKASAEGKGGITSEELFPSGSTLRNIDEAWKLDLIVSNSDMQISDLKKCKSYDDDAIINFATFLTGMPQNMKFNEHLLVRAVLKRVLLDMRKRFG